MKRLGNSITNFPLREITDISGEKIRGVFNARGETEREKGKRVLLSPPLMNEENCDCSCHATDFLTVQIRRTSEKSNLESSR